MFPTTEAGVNTWMFCSIIGYILVCYCWTGIIRKQWKAGAGYLLNRLFGGANVGVSSLLAPSLVEPNLIKLLGQSPLYLTIAGLAGLIIAITQIGIND